MRKSVIAKQIEALKSAGLDALIAMSPENFAYGTGFVVPSQSVLRWRHAATVVTADGRTAVLCVDMEETTVRDRLPDTEIRVWREFNYDAMNVLADLLGDLGLRDARVGLEMDYVPAGDMAALRDRLPGVTWIAAEGLFNRMRMFKTPEEVDLLRRLSRITDQAIKTALESVSVGSTEMDLAAAVTGSALRLGAEDYKFLIVATGERSHYPNVGPTERALKQGDLIRLEIFGMLSGYHAGICRTAVVDKPTSEVEKIWANLVACRDIVMAAIEPGARAAEVYQKFLSKFSELGFKPISFVGHGIGLFLHEEPYLGAGSDAVLEAGMVLGIEPLVYAPGRFGLQCKDMVTVTESGCELLSDVTDVGSLFRVS